MITVNSKKARELRTAGWDQKNASFDWCIDGGTKTRNVGKESLRYRNMRGAPVKGCIDPVAAPNSYEISEELIEVKNIVITPAPFAEGGWRINHDVKNGSSFCGTLANALSDMWIYLKENNLLSSEKDEYVDLVDGGHIKDLIGFPLVR